jgi:hypothetical protein
VKSSLALSWTSASTRAADQRGGSGQPHRGRPSYKVFIHSSFSQHHVVKAILFMFQVMFTVKRIA